mmetsp:Transcript_76694/g.225145  ORF Transcript_76694/g.225145 Transcript_76694/m.225145 type:complete len:260 (+) Transcript_76694:2920-3699(+)
MTFSASSAQDLPAPEAKALMKRLRSRMPKQWQLQWDHSPHSESSQSTSATQGGSSEQTANSSRTPLTGRPQASGWTSTSRRRERKPPEQVAEHWDHSIHWPQTPSTQPASQVWVLQGLTWLLSPGSHRLPPLRGATATARLRCLLPPPQEQLQADHASQSLHWQSTMSQRWSSHATISSRGPSQAFPSSDARASTLRVRVVEPGPQGAEHWDQGLQAESWQSFFAESPHGPVLHVAVSFKAAASQTPPSLFARASFRSR